MTSDRRTFLKQTSTAGLGLIAAPSLRFGKISPNDKVVVGVMGLAGRGHALARVFSAIPDSEVAYVADVDSRILDRTVEAVRENQERSPTAVQDFRQVLDDTDVDALVIAAPDHWHTPASIMALQAGKHVYVEKPLGHNPREGELLVEAQRKYGQVVQMGNQQRSSAFTQQIIREIHGGLIGRPYLARTWYANTRGPIGNGQEVPVPEGLDYDLWQGPAPRTPYRDNIIHYNWHWFWRWGTGESCNNGTHELDIARWALQVDYPVRASSVGGRYHYEDDWEFYDTQIAGFEFGDDRCITWEGRSCNAFPIAGRGRGTSVHGTEGTVVMDRDGFEVYDLENELVRSEVREAPEASMDVVGGGDMTDGHAQNFAQAIRGEAVQNSEIEEGHKSVLLCHLANIAQVTGRALAIDPSNGRIVDDAQAMEYWSREYEPGWEPVV